MVIERHETLDAEGAKPIISGVVAVGNLVYVKGVTAAPVGDITDQTRQVLQAVAGSGKSKLLTAQVWLSDMRMFRQHNIAWNEWVDPANPGAGLRESPPVHAGSSG